MDNRNCQLLYRLLKVISEQGLKNQDLDLLEAQLLQELELLRTCIKIMSLPSHSQEISWTNHQEELV